MKTKLMDRLFSGNEPEFSEKVQEGIAEARDKGSATMPEENLEFSAEDDGTVKILDTENDEVTTATPNPEDENDEVLAASDESADQTKVEEQEKSDEKAELEQQIEGNLEEINKAVDDMKEDGDKDLAQEVKTAVKQMSADLFNLDPELGINVDHARFLLKRFSDAADEVIEAEETVTEEPDELGDGDVEVKAECGDKSYSIRFKGKSKDYIVDFMKSFSDKIEETETELEGTSSDETDDEIEVKTECGGREFSIKFNGESMDQISDFMKVFSDKLEEIEGETTETIEETKDPELTEAEKAESDKEEAEATIENNLEEINKAVDDLEKSGDKDLAEKIEKTVEEVKEQLDEAKDKGVETEKMESTLKTYSDRVNKVKANLSTKSFSNLDAYLDMAPINETMKDRTFSTKERKDAESALGGCLMHKF
jgi:mevalonate kinase